MLLLFYYNSIYYHGFLDYCWGNKSFKISGENDISVNAI